MGQERTYANILVTSFGIEDGLNTSSINCFLRGSDGMIWIGTTEGLNRFDGHNFKLYKASPSDSNCISGNVITDLVEDKNGKIWISTVDGGVSVFDKEQEAFTSFKSIQDSDNSLSNNAVIDLFIDDQYVWAGTYWGLNRIDISTFSIKRYFYLEEGWHVYHNQIASIKKDSKNNIWLGTKSGLLHLKNGADNLEIPVIKHDPEHLASNASINDMLISEHDQMYIAHIGGLDQIDLNEGKVIHRYLESQIPNKGNIICQSLTEDKYGNIFIGTDGYGIFVYNPNKEQLIPFSPDNAEGIMNLSISDIYIDHEGLIWVGSLRKGFKLVTEFNKNFNLYTQYSSTTSSDPISFTAFDQSPDGTIWIGTYREGLYQFNPQTKSLELFKWNGTSDHEINNYVIKSMEIDEYGNIYLGTYLDGLVYIDFKNHSIKKFLPDPNNANSISNPSIWDIEIDEQNNLWLGTLGGGLNYYSTSENKFTIYDASSDTSENSLLSNYISKLLLTDNGNLWIGTIGGGASYFNPKENSFVNFIKELDDISTPSYNEIIDINIDSKNRVWVGTKGGGLFEVDLANNIINHHPLFDEKGSSILSIQPDAHDNLWLGTYIGLVKYNPDLNQKIQFDKNDGIQGKEFSSKAKLLSKDGILYFGGNNGFNEFDPEQIQVSEKSPQLAFTDFFLFNKPVDYSSGILNRHINFADNIVLKPGQNVFSIEFAALDYTFPKRNNFSFYLEGFDDTWNYSGNSRLATYTNIPPGNYTFKIKSTNYDGVWGNDIKTIKVEVLPPWYLLRWVQFSFIAVGLFMVVIFILMRTRYVYKQKQLLEDTIQERTADIRKQKLEIESKNAELNDKNEKIRESHHKILLQNEELKTKNRELSDHQEQLGHKTQLLQKAHSELQHVNKELLHVNENLENSVKARTRELENTLDKLIKSDDGINTFLYKSSHDLRGPVTTLLGLTNLAKIENKETNISGYIKKIERTCLQMLRFLRKLNETQVIFRINKRNQEIKWKELFHQVNSKLIENQSNIKSNIKFELKNADSIISDPVLLKTIIINLAENCFTSENDNNIKLLVRISSDQDHLNIDFYNNNHTGKLDNEISNLVNQSTKISSESGIGLFLAQRAVEILDGDIKYTSSGKSIFKVSIPLKNKLVNNETSKIID